MMCEVLTKVVIIKYFKIFRITHVKITNNEQVELEGFFMLFFRPIVGSMALAKKSRFINVLAGSSFHNVGLI